MPRRETALSEPGAAPEGLMPRREALLSRRLGRRQKGGIPLFGKEGLGEIF